MYNAEEIKNLVQSTVQTAGARIKPIEENTRRIIGDTASKVRTTSYDGIRKVEETLKSGFDNLEVGQWIPQADVPERIRGIVQNAVSHLDFPTQEDLGGLRESLSKLRKDVYSMKKRVENRALNKDLNALIKRVEKLEKANTKAKAKTKKKA